MKITAVTRRTPQDVPAADPLLPQPVRVEFARDRLASPTQRGLRLSPRAAALLLQAFGDISRDGQSIRMQDLRLHADGMAAPEVRVVVAWLVHTDIGRGCFQRMATPDGVGVTRDDLTQLAFRRA